MHIKKGDKVKIIAGASRGKTGTVLKALPKEGKVIVEGINVRKRHQKPLMSRPGGIVEIAMPVDASNVKKES